jgi:integrase
MPLVFCRPNELRYAEWSEFDFDDNIWRLPATKMKMSRDHIIPLSRQALSILNDMKIYSGDGKYVFPSPTKGKAVHGQSSIVNALRRIGYTTDQMCAHGFRAMASTLLNELGYPPEVIERQLAHVDRNKVRAAYNRAEYLPERRKMMQDWADYCDSLRERARAMEIPPAVEE